MKTVVGIFGDVNQATRARDALSDLGIANRDIKLFGEGGKGIGATKGEGLTGANRKQRIEGLQDMGVPTQAAEGYAEEVERGNTVVAVTCEDVHLSRCQQILSGTDIGESGRTSRRGAQGVDGRTPHPGAQAGKGERIPVVEERLDVGKRATRTGGVRVETHVRDEPVEERVRLKDEQVRVERESVDRPVSAEDAADLGDREIEVETYREEPVVDKEARVVEEIRVGKESREREETVRDTVRRTDVDVQQPGAGGGPSSQAFRQHYDRNLSGRGAYEDLRPAYELGADLGREGRFGDFNQAESEARRRWALKPGRPDWSVAREACRHGFEKASGGRRPYAGGP